MPGTTSQVFYNTSGQAANTPADPANTFDLSATSPGGATDLSTTLTSSSTTANFQLIKPKTAGAASAGAALPATNAAATGSGYRMTQADLAATSTAQRLVPAGSWALTQAITTGTYALLASNPSYAVQWIIFKINSSNVSTELGRVASSSTAIAASTLSVLTASITLPQVLLAPGESIQVEAYLFFQATANVLNQVTNNTVKMSENDTNERVTLPAPGLRTLYTQSATDTIPAPTEATSRVASHPRSATDSIPTPTESPVRQSTYARAATDSLPVPSESPARVVSHVRSSTDAIATLVDTASRVFSAIRAATDSIPTLVDSAARRFTGSRSATDSIPPPTESPARALTYGRSPTDNIGPTGGGTVVNNTYVTPIFVFDE